MMLRWILCSGCLLFATVVDAAPLFRFQALLDADGDAGCVLQTGAGTLRADARVYALADRQRVDAVVYEQCRGGAWHEVQRDPVAWTGRRYAGSDGADAIEWGLPLSALEVQGEVSVRMLAERLQSPAFDVVGDADGFSTMTLALTGGVPQPIPALRWTAAGLLMLLLFAAVRHSPLAWRGGALALAVAALMLQHVGAPAARSDAALRATMRSAVADPANDLAHPDAAVDVLRAETFSDGTRAGFRVEVNNLDEDGLADGAKVLFLGNSLTYSNDLPEIVRAIARQAGRDLVVHSITRGGANLEDLYRGSDALREIARGRYQLVVMQQGPSSLPESQVDLRQWTARFAAPIRASGARPALYMVWPDITRLAYLDAVRDSYSNAAEDVDGMFIPAGEAWRRAWSVDAGLALYAGDDFHPSAAGSYLAALSIFAELYRQTPVGLPATITLDGGETLRFSAPTARLLQQSAWAAHLAHGRAGY
jgi:hypothetical protein